MDGYKRGNSVMERPQRLVGGLGGPAVAGSSEPSCPSPPAALRGWNGDAASVRFLKAEWKLCNETDQPELPAARQKVKLGD